MTTPESNPCTVSVIAKSREVVEEEEDAVIWRELNRKMTEVQSALDRNRVLIQQVNENHNSKSRDVMSKNVNLIREINGNMFKVASIYSDLASGFKNSCLSCHASRDAETKCI